MKKRIIVVGSFILCLFILVNFTFITIVTKISSCNKEVDNLIGKIVYIDPGHGGKDNGASVEKVLEDDINLKISQYLMELLINSNSHVLITRTGDYDLASLYQKNRKKEDLKNRVGYINASKPDVFISIHLNTYPSSNVKGGQVFYQKNDSSKLLAGYIQEEFNQLSSLTKKAKFGDYYILNNAKPVGVLLECGFLSNQQERINLSEESYQRKIASKIFKGIIKYFSDGY